jgi:hypothetical protein
MAAGDHRDRALALSVAVSRRVAQNWVVYAALVST